MQRETLQDLVNEVIRAHRSRKRLSVLGICRRSGISSAHLYNAINGVRGGWSDETVAKFAKANRVPQERVRAALDASRGVRR